MTQLYNSLGYVDIPKIMDRSDTFDFIIGARGTGKSYGILDVCRQLDSKFIYMRRTQTEADLISSDVTNPFKTLNQDKDDDIHIMAVSGIPVFCRLDADGNPVETLGYITALSTFANIRGMDFSDVTVIFYDEFIPEKRARPIREEFEALMNAYETVNRNRELKGEKPVKLICAANSNDIANPIFLGLQIVNRISKMAEKGIEEYHDPDRELSVYMLMHSPVSRKKMETALYKLTAASRFQDMAIRNIFDIDLSAVRSANLKEFKPVVRVGELVIYKHKGRREYYARCGSSGTVPVVLSTSDIDRKRFLKRYNTIYLMYLQNHVYFEDETAMIIFERLFN